MPPSADPTAVELRDVVKTYAFRGATRSRIRERLGARATGAPVGFTALRGVNLRVGRGEKVGLVGRNGAGKTTLLRLIAGSSYATSGDVLVNGEVQALMELGVAFHQESTGRMNIRSSLVHLGLSGERLEAAIADVVDFVELNEHLDQPILTYSLGMKTRLMFATATALQPDVLLIDEILGAGDPYFTAKSADRVQRMVAAGCTLLMVSHSTQQMLQFVDRAVWLDQGQIVREGEAVDVLNAYEAFIEHNFALAESGRPPSEASVPDPAEESSLTTTLSDGREVHSWPGNRGVKITRVSFSAEEPVAAELDLVAELPKEFALRYVLTFWRSDGRRVARVENPTDRFFLAEGETRAVRVELGEMLLGPGDYAISFSVYDLLDAASTEMGRAVRYHVLSRAIRFTVEPRRAGGVHAATTLPASWDLQEAITG